MSARQPADIGGYHTARTIRIPSPLLRRHRSPPTRLGRSNEASPTHFQRMTKLIQVLDGKSFPICGFPGIGKSHLSREHGWPDSDSSKFSWVKPVQEIKPLDLTAGRFEKIRHPEWPNNYLDHIKSISGPVLVSTHEEIRDLLSNAGFRFWVCYPERCCKQEYLQRYRDRGSSLEFIHLLDQKWDEWITGLEQDTRPAGRIVLKPGEFASDQLITNPQLPWCERLP